MWSPKRQDGPTKIVGPAYTVQYAPVDDPSPKFPSHYVSLRGRKYLVEGASLTSPLPTSPWYFGDSFRRRNADPRQIDSIPEGAVLFVSCPAKTPNAVYGGLMSARAQASKAAGSVIDGRFRDVQEHRYLDYPVSTTRAGGLSVLTG